MSPDPPAANKILVVDDELSVRESVGYALEQEGFEVIAADGEEAEGRISDDSFDLLILDILMPGKSGLDICREVRAQPGPDHPADRQGRRGRQGGGARGGCRRLRHQAVLGPRAARPGARPAPPARARPLERRGGDRDRGGPVSIDLARHLVSVRGEPVNLTRSEFQVLRLLAENPGQVFSRKEIMEELWQTEFQGDVRACDVHISNLRQKVERDPQTRAGAHRAPGRLPVRRSSR